MNFTSIYRFTESVGLRLAETHFSEPGIVILAYHDVSELPPEVQRNYIFNTPPLRFEKQMSEIKKLGIEVIPLDRAIALLEKRQPLTERYLVITFDDGYHSLMKHAIPILKQYRFPATLFITTGYLGNRKPFPWLRQYLNGSNTSSEVWHPLHPDDIRELASLEEFTIGSHTHSHYNWSLTAFEDYIKDLKKSITILQNITGNKITFFSYPYSFAGQKGRYRSRCEKMEKALKGLGFQGVCTTQMGLNRPGTSKFRLKRMQVKHYDSMEQFRARVMGNLDYPERIQRCFHALF